MKRFWTVLLGLATTVSAVAVTGCSSPGEYPSRPITMIVPWGAGGGTDAVARTIASLMERELGVPVNVVTRTGGSGVVGHQAIASAPPDGYTFGIITVEITMMHHMGLTDLTYEGLTPLGLVNADAAAIQVRADSPYGTLDELMQAIRTSPPRTFQASGTAQGGIWHVALYAMLDEADIPPTNVAWIPSNSAAEGLLDLMSGGVDMVAASHPESRALIDAGRVRSLAILDEAPSALYPDVPTGRDEIGATSMIGVWRGFAAPPGLPEEIERRLETALKSAYDSEEFREFMTSRGFGMRWAGPDEFEQVMAAEDEQMGSTMRRLGMLP
jgi:tripartite-type tricarboxylate transporter receptor subunit TctC